MKSKTIKRVIVAIICIVGLLIASQFIKNRNGINIKCNAEYPVSANLVGYRQDDDRWKNYTLGDSKYDMGSSGCITACISSAISEAGNPLDPEELVLLLNEKNVYDSEGNMQWGELDKLPGFHAEVYSDLDPAYIDQCLSQGRYPIVKVHRKSLFSYHHFVLIVGSENGNYICMDPLKDGLTKLSDYNNRIYLVRCVWYEDESAATEDAPATDTSAIDAPADETASETEKSPFDIWEFEGYVDECDKYTWQDEFKNCDYDGDGKIDRLSRSWNGDKELATYTIEFGNGDKLVTPEGYETGFPHVQAGDLDGDGVKEILVTLTYDTSTDPYAFGDMWLFDRNQTTGEYEEVELPLVEIEKGAKGFNVDYDKPEDNKIKFTLREAGLSKTEEVDADYLSYWWSDDLTTQQISVFYAEILEQEGSGAVLRCYVEPLHRWGLMMGFNLNYVNGKYEIGYIEIDSPHSWE